MKIKIKKTLGKNPAKKTMANSPTKPRKIPTNLPKTARAESSRKTPISKKAPSHPDDVNSADPRKTGNIMSRPHYFKIFSSLLIAWFFLTAIGHGKALSRLSTRFLARGEQALLQVSVVGIQPTAFPDIPAVKGVQIHAAGTEPQTQLLPGRRLEYVFEYLVSSYDTGNHILPSFKVMAGGVKFTTEPIEFTVFNPDDLQWSEAVVGNTKFRYATAFRVMNPTPYEGETIPVEIKLFVPRDLFVEDWGIPDFQRDGLTAWRFQPSAMRGQINLLGMPYISVAYPSTLTPTRTGKIGIGPATLRLITTQVVMDGVLRRVSLESNLAIPKLELNTRPLPASAPEGFENAVGDFKIQVSAAVTEVQEGDPIPVQIVVSGSGNLDTLRPPKPADSAGWKLYDAATEQRGDERRDLSGTTVFQQFMRPLELKSAVPPFRLVFFDPKEKSYKTVSSEPILLNMKPAATPAVNSLSPPQALSVPVERMTDILGLLSPAELTVPAGSKLPAWMGHAIGGLLALCLIIKALWMRHGHRFHKDPVKVARLKALREIERIKGDDNEFLMSAGRYIEQWISTSSHPEVQGILAERDALCFQPDKSNKPLLEPKRRHTILNALRKAALTSVIFWFLGNGQTHAAVPAMQAREAYDSAKYEEAIALWLKAGQYENLSPDVLYNIGNACYRAGSPGYAALYFRRTLARDPAHQEARQNLRFIERKYGSITIHRPEYQYVLSRISLTTWQNILWAGAWLCGLAALVFPASRPGARLRLFALAAFVIGPLLATCGALGWRYFPNDAEFAPLARQAIVISEKAILHADAARTSPEVIDAPPGSLCEVIQQSGRWSYVAFATKTRGWIPSESIEKILPKNPPEPPKIRKPKVDGKSA
jgi:hypothetical protein